MRNGRGRTPGEEEHDAAAPPREPPAQDGVDEASEESFPASDPPAFTPLHPGPPGEHPD